MGPIIKTQFLRCATAGLLLLCSYSCQSSLKTLQFQFIYLTLCVSILVGLSITTFCSTLQRQKLFSQPVNHNVTIRLGSKNKLHWPHCNDGLVMLCHAFHCIVLLAEINLYRPALMVHLGFKPNRAHVTPLDLTPLVTCRSKHQIQGSVRVVEDFHYTSILLLQSFHKSLCTILCSQ